MLAAMPIFNLDFSSPHRPVRPSPLSSSPIRPSQSSPPLSPRDPNTLPRPDTQSSPIREPSAKFRFASRSAKPNPLRQPRENAQENRRSLFLRNVRQRADDKKWLRRGGDQEALKLEWSMLDRQRRQQKDADLDGIVFEDEIEDISELQREASRYPDDAMVDAMALEEEEELNAMLSILDTEPSQPVARPPSPSFSLSDDEDYDSLFANILSQPDAGRQGFASSGQMEMDLS